MRIQFLFQFKDLGVWFSDPEEYFVFTVHLTCFNSFFETFFKEWLFFFVPTVIGIDDMKERDFTLQVLSPSIRLKDHLFTDYAIVQRNQ
ncbi:MAG: hypothetical protein CL914_06145 [Deltaproteobacteria bacterium]|nr:hypothetical protein [Deltaproteobacteria bacterium]